MSRKTRRVSRKQRRKTLRRIPRRSRKGGGDPNLMPPNAKEMIPSDNSFGSKIASPVNSDNSWHKIA